MTPAAALDRGVGELDLALPRAARAQLLDYVQLLAKWNRTYNLTAIRDPLHMVSHHLLDSLTVLPHLPLGEAATLVDAGSGAGLPGIPLAIARPQWHLALVEASGKKCAFLRQAAIELRLANIEVHEGRVEQWQPQLLFGAAISRAFAGLGAFLSATRHVVQPGGLLAAMKASRAREELGELPAGHGCQLIHLRVPLLDAERSLVLCRRGA